MAVPAPSGPPVPYWPSVIIKPETVRGVGMYYVNLILDIIFGGFALVVGLSSIFIATTSDPIAALGIIAALGAATCGLVIVFVINFIMSLMSVLRMHHGADEYGPEHALNTHRGWIFKWLGTTLSTAATVLVVYLVIAGGSAFLFGGSVPATVYIPLVITAFWTAGVAAKAQMYRYMVRSLQPPQTRRWSDIASLLIPALGAIGIVIVGYYTVRVITLLANPTLVTLTEASRLSAVMITGVFLPPGFALVGYLIFLVIYGRTRERLSQGLAHLYASVPPPGAWNPGPPAAPSMPASSAAGQPASAGEGFCGRCGHPFAERELFCTNCGTPRPTVASSPG
jgi:hypothetical protein